MMRVSLIVLFVCLALSTSAQLNPITNLPAIQPQYAGFNKDSIKALEDTIS